MYDELIERLRHAARLADKGLVIAPSVCLEAADAIEDLTDRNVGKWIPVAERLPDPGVFVLVTTCQKTGASVVRIGLFSGTNYGWSCGGASKNVVAWMPLPEPYEVS